MTAKKFNSRGFVSILIAITGIVELLTGIVLYIAPPGRIAHWNNWTLLWLTKEQWQSIHTILGYIFVIACGFHLYYNWRVFLNYLKIKISEGRQMKKELLAALILSILTLVFSIGSIPPLSYVMDFGQYATDSWETKDNKPPIAHAEKLSIKEVSESLKQPVDKTYEILKKNNIIFNGENEILQKVADRNNKSPNDIYNIISMTPDKTSNEEIKMMQKAGYGRMTLKELSAEMDIPLDLILRRLKARGIDVEEGQKLKEIAGESGMPPLDVINIIRGR